MKVLQAMALGKAVVTTSRGADGLIVGSESPPLVIAEDEKAIAKGIAPLFT